MIILSGLIEITKMLPLCNSIEKTLISQNSELRLIGKGPSYLSGERRIISPLEE